ncbi:MAG: phosphoadenosine phosphosulfate reductase [Sphingobacteriales bacterium]|nr:MAG: phosphoadenosine phosphosulfate reductase [Sphingobacteriales bacterium]
MNKARHVLGISGGKDSAALAIYLFQKYPQLQVDYYTCDTGKEMDETYELLDRLESYLGKKFTVLKAAENSPEASFDHFLKMYGGYLPSSNARWCTKKLKLEPFEKYIGNDPVISYVGIRADEDREGYISHKQTVQSIFPFRKNIWSEELMTKFLSNANLDLAQSLLSEVSIGRKRAPFERLLVKRLESGFNQKAKLEQLLNLGVKDFNQLVFRFLKTTSYPLSLEEDFPLLENEEELILKDIYGLLTSSGVGIPAYYNKVTFETEIGQGQYARSRSGCFFCFFQQKIEWVWLLEQHTQRFLKAMEYEDEKAGFTWNQNESLRELMQPERIKAIKEEYISRRTDNKQSPYLLDILGDEESEGCAACFI